MKTRTKLSRRTFMEAMRDVPGIMKDPGTITLQDGEERLLAVIHDFMNVEIGIPVKLETIKRLLVKADKETRRFMLYSFGFLSSPNVLPVVKEAINILGDKVDPAGYILRELYVMAFQLKQVLDLDRVVEIEERREEIARKLLQVFQISIEGESEAESAEILANLDSIEISKLTSDLEVRIRKEIEDALEEQRRIAAAKPSRE